MGTERNENVPLTLSSVNASKSFCTYTRSLCLDSHDCGFDSSPAVSEQALEDVGGPRRAEHGPLDASVFEVAAVDLVGAEPLFDALLDAVAFGEAHGARSRGEAVVHKVHGVLNGWRQWEGG